MKKLFKILAIIAIAAIIGFSFAACDDDSTESGGGGGGGSNDNSTFNSISDLETWLEKQPENSPLNPYIVKLNVNNISNIRTILNNATDKYVYLDLSGSSITTIPASLFYGNSSSNPKGCATLTGITIPDGVTSIGSYAFHDCTNLTKVIIPNSVINIEASAFYNCTNLTNITIGNNVKNIKSYAFYNCTNLTSIIIPNSVTSIENSVFSGCTNLISVTFQGTIPLSGFDNNAFYLLGDLRSKFYATDTTNGTPGTYTNSNKVWTKQP